ncbi:SpoIIIAH-like family protein [Paenibacillus marinisediminis]
MNTKRQTIWLVSMLSLMVVLSAYYLFTEDATPETVNGNGTQVTVKGNAKEAAVTPDVQYQEVTGNSTSAKDGKNNVSQGSISEETQKILDQVESQGVMSRSLIEEKQMERHTQYEQTQDKLLAMINDATITDEKLYSAYDEMEKIEDREQKITNLEAQLQQDYDNAVITQEEDKYKVVVQSNKLEVKQAVDIMSKLMKELNVTQDKVSIQYVTD